ncbi:hypothetical protein B9G69_004645 [Bdellovibrio sp. SKB1291214]|uniref:hypothetical protein n=1 Tax=Bdellovibrio sp. SKB1291214 TaxID=1732569 RepID=UPI0020CCD6CB|nr:hypothetical protein [Bdellovibrio sp. SKB1291214]UYL09863.1 hypothetical protein B9G69_004645 [Bdellovibrio sp. SKB1291214]
MRRNRFLEYLVVQVLVIAAVMLIFAVIKNKQIAATIAGVLFVVMPISLMAWEHKKEGFQEMTWFAGMLQFWVIFALPILGIRLLNWGVPFDQLFFWGIPGPLLHSWSSKSYMVMMLVTAIRWWRVDR